MNKSQYFLKSLRLPLDFLMTISAFLIAYNIRAFTDLIPGIQLPINLYTFPDHNSYLKTSALFSAFLILFFIVRKEYSFKNKKSLSGQLLSITSTTTLWLFFIISLYFLFRTFPFSRLALIFTWAFSIFLISLGRTFLELLKNFLLKKGYSKTTIIILGKNALSETLQSYLEKKLAYEVIGIISNFHELETLSKVKKPSEIIDTTSNSSEELLEFCRENQIEYSFIPSQLELQQTNVSLETLAGFPVIKLKPTPLEGWGRIAKRLFDIVGSVFGIIIFSPIFIIAAILIKLDDPKATIIFKFLDDGSRTKRVGKNGKLFNFYKFRTMIPNSHSARYNELLSKNKRGENWDEKTPLVKIKDDPRITKIGKFLRRTSIDELPQLFNVLKGEMSLVGPRPHLPEEVAKYQKHHKFLLTIKPGITSLGAISGRFNLEFEDEVRLDTFYIENWSIWLDIKVIIKTIFIVFKKYE